MTISTNSIQVTHVNGKLQTRQPRQRKTKIRTEGQNPISKQLSIIVVNTREHLVFEDNHHRMSVNKNSLFDLIDNELLP